MNKKEFQIFLKPVGALCNLRCSYCYYLSKSAFSKGEPVFNNENTAGEYIRQHIEASEDVVLFSWHGGEPLLAGIDFYRKMVSLQKKYNKSGKKILNGIQTNGTLVDDKWAQFLRKEKFVVGLSMDGPQRLHDIHRKTNNGSATFKNTLRGYHILLSYGILPEILCVVNDANSGYPLEIYRYFKSLGTRYMTFLPLVERIEGTDRVSDNSVKASDFGVFMSVIFDEWSAMDIGTVKVQLFEEACRPAFGQDHTLCIFKKTCGGVPVIERNGDFYSCDHFVDSDHRVGNILRNTLTELLNSPVQVEFGKRKLTDLPEYCLNCNVLEMCNGECPKNRFINTPTGEAGLNYLCEGYKLFFNHSLPFIKAVSAVYNQRQTGGVKAP